MSTEKEIKKVITAKELFGVHFNGLHYEDVTPEKIEKYAIDFAKRHVEEVIEKASKGFKNPDNIRYVKKCYPLDGIV